MLRLIRKAFRFALVISALLETQILAADSLAPTIVGGFPTAKTVAAGIVSRFEIEAIGAPPLYYHWSSRSTNIVSTNAWADIVFAANESQSPLNVIVYNRYGYAVRQCAITVIDPPQVTIDPLQVAVLEGGTFTIAANSSVVRFQWLKGEEELAGQTNYYLRRTNVTVADAGDYRVAITNEIGLSAISDVVAVRVLTTNSPPVIFDPPAELHLLSTDTKFIDAQAVGFSTSVQLHLQDGSVLTKGPQGSFQIPPESGEIYLVAFNSFGSSTSHVCKVVVHPQSSKIILDGSSDTQTNIAAPYEPLTLSVGLLQGEDIHYQWYYYSYPIPGADSPILHVTDRFDPTQLLGPYELRATNEISSDVRRFDVEADILQNQWLMRPINGWAGQIGDPVTLFAQPAYFAWPFQWYRNDLPLSGETNYTLQFTLSAETLGTYHVVMHDIRRDFISNPANVTLRDTTNANRDFRLIAEIPYHFDPPSTNVSSFLPPMFGGINSNVVTLIIDGSLYRWSGALEKIVDREMSLPPFQDGHWKISSCSTEENGVISFLADSDDVVPRSAVFEWSTSGLKLVVQSGDPIIGRPDISVQTIRNIVRSNGKIAMEVFGTDAPINWDQGYHALHVWDGTNSTQWLDLEEPTTDVYAVDQLAFDGQSIAFTGWSGINKHAVYSANRNSLEKIISRWDLIPGFTNRIGDPISVAIKNGKILFTASVDTGDDWIGLIEYSPDAEQKFRFVAKSGTTTERGLSLRLLQNNFAYAGDGSILFSASAGGFFSPGADTNMILQFAYGIFREHNGVITEELTSWDRVAGREIDPVLAGADGTNYVVSGSMSLGTGGWSYYTTLPGLPRTQNTRIELTQLDSGQFKAVWNDGGRLQSSRDLINWHDILEAPGTITNDFSKIAVYLRVYHP